MSKTMGRIIKELRLNHGLTQEMLAERLGVTYQAVSKWENDLGMPDISQVVPLASVLEVTTDTLFGIAQTDEAEEAFKIVSDADNVEEYGNLDSYLKAYKILSDGLKKYPSNLILMNNCMSLGLSLSMPQNGWIYAKDSAKEIASKTICQANFIIANSKNITDILRARQVLIFLYCSRSEYDLAAHEARKFPVRADFTLYSSIARVNEYMENYEAAIAFLCTDIDYSLQAFEDNVARLGRAYYNSGKYADAIETYEIFFFVMKAIFKDELIRPYHDFDSGDCYLLLACSYLAVGQTEKAMDAIENSVVYYLDLIEGCEKDSECNSYKLPKPKSPLVKSTELTISGFSRDDIKKKLLEKLSQKAIEPLRGNERYAKLIDRVSSIA